MSDAVEVLRKLDPDDPRTPSQQIANALRAAILMDIFAGGDKLPSQHELSRHYGVARETVKSALQILDRERLIVSRQGSGVFVRTRRGASLDLQGLLRNAFDRPHVSIDYAGFNGESLSNTLPPSLAEIGAGTLSIQSLRLRLLLVDPGTLQDFPQRIDGQRTDRALRQVFAGITRRAVRTLSDTVAELTGAGLLTASVEVRTYGLGPMMKLYMLNNEKVLFGLYPATTYSVTMKNESVPLHHPSGWDGTLFNSADGESLSVGPQTSGPPFTEQAAAWFESIWSTIAKPYRP